MRPRAKSTSGIAVMLLLCALLLPLLSFKVEPVKASGAIEVDLPFYCSFYRAAYYWMDPENWTIVPPSSAGPWLPTAPLVFDLQSNGFKPGDWLFISYNFSMYLWYRQVEWRYGGIPPGWQLQKHENNYSPLMGVFSSDGVVDPDINKLERVPGAIDPGVKYHYVTPGVFDYSINQLDPQQYFDTDIEEDFWVSPLTGFEIQIPEGAKYLILGFMANAVQVGLGGGWFKVTLGKDSDGDGMPDFWEEDGIDVDADGEVDLDLPMLGADWRHKDIFVEIDYMGDEVNCSGHYPNFVAIQDVKDAFRNSPVSNPDGASGVNLHVLVDERVDHKDVLANQGGWMGFEEIKRGNFGTDEDRNDTNKVNILEAKKRVYHYCLFVHSRQGQDGWGVGELPGNDFMVSMGNATATREYHAAVFMHELGHNLGLEHGGGDEINFKPNYLSIMNYLFQYDGSPVRGRPLDYSRRQLITLNESALDEAFGIGGLPGDKTAFSLPHLNFYGAKCFVADGVWIGGYDASGSLDWNGNGTIEGNGTVSANLNDFPEWKYSSEWREVLTGFNDWANLNFNFRSTAGYADSVHPAHAEDDLAYDVIHLMSEAGETTPVIPELPAWAMLPSLMTITLVAAVMYKKRKHS